jgi:hypothetical protein
MALQHCVTQPQTPMYWTTMIAPLHHLLFLNTATATTAPLKYTVLHHSTSQRPLHDCPSASHNDHCNYPTEPVYHHTAIPAPRQHGTFARLHACTTVSLHRSIVQQPLHCTARATIELRDGHCTNDTHKYNHSINHGTTRTTAPPQEPLYCRATIAPHNN